MSAQRDGESWAFVIEGPRGPNGQRTRIKRRGFATKQAARTAERETMGQVAAGTYVPRDRGRPPIVPKVTTFEPPTGDSAEYPDGTVGHWLLARWLPRLERDERDGRRSAHTVGDYITIVQLYLIPFLGHLRWATLDGEDIEEFMDALRDRPNAKPLAPNSRRQIHKVLKVCLNDAIRMKDRKDNPAGAVQPPKATDTERTVYTLAQVQRLLAHLRRHRLYALWHTAIACGMRRAELAGLRRTDVDLDNGAITVINTRTVGRHGVIEKGPKTKHGKRTVAIDADHVAVLRSHFTKMAAERLAAGNLWHDSGYVFVKEDGSPYRPETILTTLHRIQDELGLPRITVHDLRHTCATLLFQAQVHPKVVQERLGHSSIQITLDLYSHRVPGMDRDAAKLLGRLISSDDELGDRRAQSDPLLAVRDPLEESG